MNKKSTKRKPLTQEQIDKRTKTVFKRKIRNIFTGMGFTYVPTNDHEMVIGLRKVEIDALFIFENIWLLCEDTIKSANIKEHIQLNQRIIAGNAQFTGIAAGRGVGFTTGLLLLRKGLGMRETPIRPHSWHCRMQSGYQYGGNRKRPPVWRRHRGSLRPRGRNLGGVEGMTGGCGSGCDPAIHTRRLRVYHRPRRLRMASRISIFFAARRFEPLNSMG